DWRLRWVACAEERHPPLHRDARTDRASQSVLPSMPGSRVRGCWLLPRRRCTTCPPSCSRANLITMTPKSPDELRRQLERKNETLAKPGHEYTAEGMEVPVPSKHKL